LKKRARRNVGAYLDELFVFFSVQVPLGNGQTLSPLLLVQVHQHLLFELVLSVVNGQGVVVTIQAVNKSLVVIVLATIIIIGRYEEFISIMRVVE
jgi:hypothetical protein